MMGAEPSLTSVTTNKLRLAVSPKTELSTELQLARSPVPRHHKTLDETYDYE